MITCASSCLVTSGPDFSEPAQTRPEIVNIAGCQAEPSLAQIYQFNHEPLAPYQPAEFQACFLSEDAGEPVQSALLIDYGTQDPSSEDPYRHGIGGPDLDAASLGDGPRRVAIPWTPNHFLDSDKGCHTVTLIVTHRFTHLLGKYYCPQDPRDASTLTWFVNVCDGTATDPCDLVNCPSSGQSTPTVSCEGVPP
ncbi:MAG: hypothetical protein IT373_00420 [Polyangiaceae bacterium]|nr:hypothetical protein [Polyangiaceae bacterium]